MATPIVHKLLPVLVGIAVCLPVAWATDGYSIEAMLNNGDIGTTTEADAADLLTELAPEEDNTAAAFSTKIVTTSVYGPSMNAQDAMQSLLGGAGSDHQSPEERDCLKDVASSPGFMSQQITSGLVEAFMHKVKLSPGEKECLVNSVGDLSSEVVDAGSDAVKALQGVLGGQNSSNSMSSSSVMGMVPYLMDGAMKLTSMVGTVTSLVKDCVEGDALEILKKAGKNLINLKQLEDRLWVNGVDIAHLLANSIVHFENCDFHKFGTDIGTTLRKIALSKETHRDMIGIPEGMPKEEAVGEVMQGFFEGFFAKGMDLIVKDSLDPRVDIHLDLHKCVVGNGKLFRTVWSGAWELFASISLNPEQNDFGFGNGKRPRWMGEFMLAMLQVPTAMLRCGIDTEAEAMLMEAVKSLDHMDVTLTFPNDIAGAKTGTEKVAKAVAAWTDHHYKSFGGELGKLLRELVLLFFPRKYYVDASGHLRRQLSEAPSSTASVMGSTASVMCAVGAGVLMMFATVRACHPVAWANRQSASTPRAHLACEEELLE